MKRKKINWINVTKLVVFIFCVYMILHDLYMLAIYPFVSGKLYSWTFLGVVTFILFITVAGMIYDDFEEQLKSIPSYRPKHAKDTRK